MLHICNIAYVILHIRNNVTKTQFSSPIKYQAATTRGNFVTSNNKTLAVTMGNTYGEKIVAISRLMTRFPHTTRDC